MHPDSLFENRFYYTDERYLEFTKSFGISTGYKVFSVCFALALFLAGYFFGYVHLAFFLIFAALGVAVIVINILRPRFMAGRAMKQMEMLHPHQELYSDALFFDNHFEVTAPDNQSLALTYDKIRRCRQNSDMIVLSLDQKVAVLLDKGFFLKGDVKSFLEFLREQTKLPIGL